MRSAKILAPFWWILGLISFCGVLLRPTYAQMARGSEPRALFARDAREREKSTEQLISELANIKEVAQVAWSNTEKQFPFAGENGDSHDKKAIYPPFRELTARGIDAVPELLKHLDDKRPTALKVAEHQITVGDLCYSALGQIVHERYHVIRFGQWFGGGIDSPTSNPRLAKEARTKWQDLTRERHEDLLVKAVLKADPYIDLLALQRLCVYYPKRAEETAERLLSRPLYDHSRLWNFAVQLGKEPHESKWDRMVEKYIAENGEVVRDLIPFWFHWIHFEASFSWKPEEKARASRIMKSVFPGFDRHADVQLAAEGVREQTDLVTTLEFFESAKVDAAIHALFLKARAFPLIADRRENATDDTFYFERFVEACFQRLGKTAVSDEYRRFFLERAALLEAQEPKPWREIDHWYSLATGKRKSTPPPAEQREAAATLRRLGVGVDGWSESDDYLDTVHFFPGDEKRPFPPAALQHIGKLLATRELWIEGAGVTDEGLAQLKGLRELEDVRLKDTAITSLGVEHLAQSAGIRILDVSHSRVDDLGLVQIARFERLERLKLVGTSVTGKGLAALPSLKRLTKLDLTGCRRIKDEDLASLSRCRELTELTLEVPDVSDAGIKHLEGLSKLEDLTILSSRATPQGIGALRKKLPQANVAYYWPFQLAESPLGVLLTSPHVEILFEEATLPSKADNVFETGIWSGDEPRPARNERGIGGGLKMAGDGNLAFSVGTDDLSLSISSRHDITQLTFLCPKRGAPKTKLNFQVSFTENGATLRCGDNTFQLPSQQRIIINAHGKATVTPRGNGQSNENE